MAPAVGKDLQGKGLGETALTGKRQEFISLASQHSSSSLRLNNKKVKYSLKKDPPCHALRSGRENGLIHCAA